MKVVITRVGHNCCFERCAQAKLIRTGTIAITTVTKVGFHRNTKHFHPDCYTQFLITRKDELVAEKEAILTRRAARHSPRPQGRPRKYSDLIKSKNLISLINYHKKKGNTTVVSKLQEELRKLKIA